MEMPPKKNGRGGLSQQQQDNYAINDATDTLLTEIRFVEILDCKLLEITSLVKELRAEINVLKIRNDSLMEFVIDQQMEFEKLSVQNKSKNALLFGMKENEASADTDLVFLFAMKYCN